MKIFSRWLFKGFHAWEHRLPPAKDILLLKVMQDVDVGAGVFLIRYNNEYPKRIALYGFNISFIGLSPGLVSLNSPPKYL